jgi:hypothetical protein
MSQLTYADIKPVCPYHTDAALTKANNLLSALLSGNVYADCKIHDIAIHHKAKSDNLWEVFENLKQLIFDQLNLSSNNSEINESFEEEDTVWMKMESETRIGF